MRRPRLINDLTSTQIYNHIDGINCIVTKSGLFKTVKRYYDDHNLDYTDFIPETYLIDLSKEEKEEGLKMF